MKMKAKKKKKRIFLACVRACMWASIFYSAWISLRSRRSLCLLHFTYIFLFVCVCLSNYINYIYIYRSILITRVRARATTLTTKSSPTFALALFGLVGRQPLFTSACFLTISLSLSFSLSLSLSLSITISLFLSLSVCLSFSFLYFFRRNGRRTPDARVTRLQALVRAKMRKVTVTRAQ